MVWSLFPLIESARYLNFVSLLTSETWFMVANFASKAVFAAMLVFGNSVSITQAATAEVAVRTKTAQMAELCHEVRNPLNGVSGNLQSLELALDSGDANEEWMARHPRAPTCGCHRALTRAAARAQALVASALTCCESMRRTLDDFADLAAARAPRHTSFSPARTRSTRRR